MELSGGLDRKGREMSKSQIGRGIAKAVLLIDAPKEG